VSSVPTKQEDMVFLSPAEFQTFRVFVIPQYHPFVDFLFGTGLRFGEATALMPHHLELGSKRLHVQTAWKKQVDNSMLSLDPKSRRSRRRSP
jgi:integrase